MARDEWPDEKSGDISILRNFDYQTTRIPVPRGQYTDGMVFWTGVTVVGLLGLWIAAASRD